MLDASAAPRWRAPAECPDGAALIAMVRGYGGSTDAIRIEGLILSGDAGYRLELVLDDGVRRETRTLHARECGALVRATALVIAVGTDPVDVARQQQVDAIVPPPPVPVESSPIVEPAPATTGRRRSTTGAPRPPNARATSASRAWHGWFGIGGGVERAALPGVSGGVIGLVAARRRGLGLELGGMWLAPRSTAGSVGRVRVQLGAVALRGCPELVVGRVSFPLCLGVEVGAMRGDGRGAPGARTVVATWLAAVASAGARLGFGRVALLLRGETAIAALRPGFELREPGDPIALFTPELASVRLWLGVELRVGRASRERGLRSGRRPSPGLWSEFAVARRRKPANLENRRRMRSG
jgi:hypothetical protein